MSQRQPIANVVGYDILVEVVIQLAFTSDNNLAMKLLEEIKRQHVMCENGS